MEDCPWAQRRKEHILSDISNRRLSCCLTFDFDAMSAWIGSFRSNNPSMISRGEFGAAVGLPRVLDLLEGSTTSRRSKGWRRTWPTPTESGM